MINENICWNSLAFQKVRDPQLTQLAESMKSGLWIWLPCIATLKTICLVNVKLGLIVSTLLLN